MTNRRYAMPALDLNAIKDLTPEEGALIQGCLVKGVLRASKPDVNKDRGRVAYLWRMLCFGLSPIPAHHCMPVCADLDLKPEVTGEEYAAADEKARAYIEGKPFLKSYENLQSEQRLERYRVLAAKKDAWARELDALALRVEKSVPLEKRHGTLAWARVYGVAPASGSVLP